MKVSSHKVWTINTNNSAVATIDTRNNYYTLSISPSQISFSTREELIEFNKAIIAALESEENV